MNNPDFYCCKNSVLQRFPRKRWERKSFFVCGGEAAANKKDCNGRSDPSRGKSIGEGYAQIKILRN